MRQYARGGSGHEKGLALAILLWFIAALAILVSGLAIIAKTDMRYTLLAMGQAKAEAAADGAVQLVLAGVVPFDPQVPSGLTGSFIVGEVQTRIRVVPAAALIDILKIDETILVPLFQVGAGLSPSESNRLAQSVVQWRSSLSVQDEQDSSIGVAKVQVLEDILAVPGMNRDIFERIRGVICSGCTGGSFESSGVNVRAAPAVVGEILKVAFPDADWTSFESPGDGEPLEPGYIKVTGRLRVDVRVDTEATGFFERSVWVAPNSENPNGWQVLRKIPAKAVPSMSFDEY